MTPRRLRRIALFYSMVVTGIVAIITGFILYFWPHGPKAGKLIILGFEKQFWQDLHTYFALLAAILIILHVVENMACVKMYVRETLRS